MSTSRILAIIKKEFIHIKRDKASFIIALVMPIIFIFLFGYAVNTDVDDIDMVVLDFDKTHYSNELIQMFSNSNYYNITKYVSSIDEIDKLFNLNEVKSAIVIPPNFSKDIYSNKTPIVQFIIDGSDPTIAKTALGNSNIISNMFFAKIKKMNTNINGLDFRAKVWYNPNLKSENFTVPGVIGLVMQNITIMLTSFSLVRERERGSLELLMVTPIKSYELIIGKMVPYVLIGFIDFLMVLFIGICWFDIKVIGNIYLLIGLGFGFVICSLAIGMLISTITKTQAQAMQVSILFILPSVLLSGFIFQIDAMPKCIQILSFFIPLTYFLNILRGIILKGSSIYYLLQYIFPLTILTILFIIIACIKFKKRLD